jgi:hypothetical protein
MTSLGRLSKTAHFDRKADGILDFAHRGEPISVTEIPESEISLRGNEAVPWRCRRAYWSQAAVGASRRSAIRDEGDTAYPDKNGGSRRCSDITVTVEDCKSVAIF